MSDNKKYYYIKLKDNYFDQDNIKILESYENGYIYSLIILKLYLRSAKYSGRLMMTEKIPYDPKKLELLAGVIHHDIAHIKDALTYALNLDLITIVNSREIWMTDIQNFIGQSSTEADRIRKYRAEIEQKNTICTDVQEPCNKCTPELELEIKKEIEIEGSVLPVSKLITKSITYWNTKTNLPRCRYTIVNVSSEILRDISSHLTVFKPEEINKAIDNLSEYYEKEDPKFRVNSFQSFATKSIDRWIDEVKPWERYQDDALPDCGPQESTVPKWIEEEGVTFE